MKRITLTNELMSAALNPATWTSGTFVQNREDALAKDILSLSSWIEDQKTHGNKISESDRSKRFIAVLQGAVIRSHRQTADLDYSGYAWFHRDSLHRALEDRKTIDKVYSDTIDALR